MNSRQILVQGVVRQYSLTGLILLPKSYCCQKRIVLFLPSTGNTPLPPPPMLALLSVSTVSQCSLFSSWKLTHQKQFLGVLGGLAGLPSVYMSTRVGSGKDWGQGRWGKQSCLVCQQAVRLGWLCCSTAPLNGHGNLKKTPHIKKNPIHFALMQLRRTLSSTVKVLTLVWNAISSATAAV